MEIKEWINLAKDRAERIIEIDPHCMRGKYAGEIIKFLNMAEELRKKETGC